MVKKATKKITSRHSGKRVKRAHPESDSGQARMTRVAKTSNGLEIPVLNLKGEKISAMFVPKEIMDMKASPVLLAQAVRVFLAGQRQGTVFTKTRAEVSGGGRKPWKEKGTGRARQGSIRAPQWRGGGIVFGPQPRDFSLELPHKMRRLAFLICLKQKITQNQVVIADKLENISGKTKEVKNLVNSSQKTLLITAEKQPNINRAVRNIKNVTVKNLKVINFYDLLTHQKIIFAEDAFNQLKDFTNDKKPRGK